MEPNYLPKELRKPDEQYKERLHLIKTQGRRTGSRHQTEGTLTHLNLPAMEFNLANGFPVLTERKITFWRTPINELFAFMNGVRDARVLAEEWNVKWWLQKWATPPKCHDFGLTHPDMGDGSYGPGFQGGARVTWQAVEGHPDGGRWIVEQRNQIADFVAQMKCYREARTHVIKSWLSHYCLQHDELQRKVVVAPCHGDIQATIIDGKLTVRMQQRSVDLPIGGPANMIQYAAWTLALGQVLGVEPETFIHGMNDAHIYIRHMDDVEKLLARQSHPFPTMHLTEEGRQITSIFDFRAHHFELREYEAEPAMTLEEAVI